MWRFRMTTGATRKGGVDRNLKIVQQLVLGLLSPPARVAWIET